jgi:translation initiation factor 1
MPDTSRNSRLVYSTDTGRVKQPPPGLTNRKVSAPQSEIANRKSEIPNDGVVRIARDKKGRGGKTATTITGLPGSDADLAALLKPLKQYCATRGTREDRTLVLQGDHRDKLLAWLSAKGHKARLAGG